MSILCSECFNSLHGLQRLKCFGLCLPIPFHFLSHILCSTSIDISVPLHVPFSFWYACPSSASLFSHCLNVCLFPSTGRRVLFFPLNILCLPFQRSVLSFSEIIIRGQTLILIWLKYVVLNLNSNPFKL